MAKQGNILNIKIEHQGNIQTFTLIPKGVFSIGYKPDCSFQLYGEQIPAKFDMIKAGHNVFILRISESMTGKVVTGDCPLSITDLIAHRLLHWEKDGYELELSEDKRAQVSFQDYCFRFEYDGAAKIAANAEVPYWKFSYGITKWLKQDLFYKFVLLLMFITGIGFSVWIQGMPLVEPKSVNLEKYTRQIAKLVFKPKKNSQRLLANKAGTATSKESEKENSNSETKEESGGKKSSEPASNAPVKTTVINKGLVGLIAGTGPSSKGSAVIEALVDRGLVRQLDELLQSGQNLEVQIPSLNDVGGNLDQVLSASSKVAVDSLISGMQEKDKVELKEKGDVNLESFGEMKGSETALGWRSEQSIRDVIMSYMGRITYAYNKHLKLEPDLKGKVIMEITIAASGEVTACRMVSSSINNSSFERELVNVIKSFRFKSIPEGEVTVQNPFIFYRRDV